MSISPNVPSPQESYHYENTGTPRWIAVLFGVLVVALAAMGFFGYTAQSRMSQDLAKTEDANKQLLQRLDQANASLADYKIATAADIPAAVPIVVEKDYAAEPYGAKGVGEMAVFGIAPAIANAIARVTGIRIKDLPITAEKLLLEIKGSTA